MDTQLAPIQRFHARTAVTIDVTIVGVLESFDATIADLSEGGAMVVGGSLPARSRCEIHYGGEIVYATVMWAEPDRMGLRFPFHLSGGPLYHRLMMARGHHQRRILPVAMRGPGGFGRRGL